MNFDHRTKMFEHNHDYYHQSIY